MRVLRNLLVMVLLVLTGSAAAQERFVKPVDEGPKNASFQTFRTQLIAALKRRDARYIYGIVDRNIKLGFGGEDGLANFKKNWKLESAKSEFWAEMLKVVSNGGTFDKSNRNLFLAPYLFATFPEDFDPFEYQAIFGFDVNLRSQPNVNSTVVAKLSYNIVKADYQNSIAIRDSDKYQWIKVETVGGKKGWVAAEYVRSSIDYRAGFEKIKGKWTLTFFLAGD